MLKVTWFVILLIKTASSYELSVVSTTQATSPDYCQFTRLMQKIEEIQKTCNENRRILQNLEQNTAKHSLPKNCQEVKERGNSVSGIYRIQPQSTTESFMVLCDMKTKEGGWTYFLNRFDGSQDFKLNWTEYKEGFGNLAGELWLGLESLHQLTYYEPNELLVELVDWDLKKVYARYGAFALGSEEEGYSLKVLGGYSGTAGDSLSQHSGFKFSTTDKDQDGANSNCASFYGGGWWYDKCGFSALTNNYRKGRVKNITDSVMYWNTFLGPKYSLKQARMMVKPRNDRSSPILPHEAAK